MSKTMKIISAVIILCAIAAASAALIAMNTTKSSSPYAGDTGFEITEKEASVIADTIRSAGLSNADIFETWVHEYIESEKSDTVTESYADADCRMTAMMLLGDQISCDSTEKYSGDYLMIDVDKIKNEEPYAFIKDKLDVFTTLFGEAQIPDGDIKSALPGNWKKHGIKVQNDNASLVSLVFTTIDGSEIFVGHTGVLIDCGKLENTSYENYLFVEKIAFGEAFIATELKDPSELIDLFSQRSDYDVEEGEPKPIVYINDELLGELR